MNVTISITLPKELLDKIDAIVSASNRTEFIETTLRRAVAQSLLEERNKRDLEIINEHYEELNAEAEDVLSYQVIPSERE